MKKETSSHNNMNEIQLADKMIRILNDSEDVKTSVENLQSKIKMKDRLIADFAHLKGKEKWLKTMITKTEDSFGDISSSKDLEKYQKCISELPAVKKAIQLLQKRIDPNLHASIYRDIKDCESYIATAVDSALSPTAVDLQKKLDQLTDSFLEEISVFASAFVRTKIKQDIIPRTSFPSRLMSQLIPRIQDFDRLEAYADMFYQIKQARGRIITKASN